MNFNIHDSLVAFERTLATQLSELTNKDKIVWCRYDDGEERREPKYRAVYACDGNSYGHYKMPKGEYVILELYGNDLTICSSTRASGEDRLSTETCAVNLFSELGAAVESQISRLARVKEKVATLNRSDRISTLVDLYLVIQTLNSKK